MKHLSLLVVTTFALSAQAAPTKLTPEQKTQFLKIVGAIGTLNNAINNISNNESDSATSSIGANPERMKAIIKQLRDSCTILGGGQPPQSVGGPQGSIKGSVFTSFSGDKCALSAKDTTVTDGTYDSSTSPSKANVTITRKSEYRLAEGPLKQELSVTNGTTSLVAKISTKVTKERAEMTHNLTGNESYILADNSKVSVSTTGNLNTVVENKVTSGSGKFTLTYDVGGKFVAILELTTVTEVGIPKTTVLLNGEPLN